MQSDRHNAVHSESVAAATVLTWTCLPCRSGLKSTYLLGGTGQLAIVYTNVSMRGSKIFVRGGGGEGGGGGSKVQRPENSMDKFFCFFYLDLNLFYSLQKGSNCFNDRENCNFQRTQQGGPTFSRGVQH